MRRDFHYYTIYTLAVHAGIKPELAYILSYASEHVDDAKTIGPLNLTDGCQFWPVRSAHSLLSPDFYAIEASLSVYGPFHFFPCLEGDTLTQKMLCYPDSTGIKALKVNVQKQLSKNFGLHYLGMALHIIADTYAHQNFNALNNSHNRVKSLKIHTSGLMDLALPTAAMALPPIAHLQATTCPDEPACIWSYKTSGGHLVKAHNPQRYASAAQSIYHWLAKDIRKYQPTWYSKEPTPFTLLEEPLALMFNLNMLLTDRIQAWLRAYDHHLFGEYPLHPYQAEDWFVEALIPVNRKKETRYKPKENFTSTNYYLLHRAMAEHLHFCRFQLFPENGIHI